jgi:hypothetical protein
MFEPTIDHRNIKLILITLVTMFVVVRIIASALVAVAVFVPADQYLFGGIHTNAAVIIPRSVVIAFGVAF